MRQKVELITILIEESTKTEQPSLKKAFFAANIFTILFYSGLISEDDSNSDEFHELEGAIANADSQRLFTATQSLVFGGFGWKIAKQMALDYKTPTCGPDLNEYGSSTTHICKY